MAEEERPLSRRTRRVSEDDYTDEISIVGGEDLDTSSIGIDGLTRRDRRRLERQRRPMETWTAEEEMIHTGQIPTMTPERIAEQEALARQKAAAAAADARLMTDEMRRVQAAEVKPHAWADAGIVTPTVPTEDPSLLPDPERDRALGPVDEAAEMDWKALLAKTEGPVVSARPTETSPPWAAPEAVADPVAEPAEEPAAEVLPEVAMQASPEPLPEPPPAWPSAEVDPEPEVLDPAEEIRRLTQQAMANLESVGRAAAERAQAREAAEATADDASFIPGPPPASFLPASTEDEFAPSDDAPAGFEPMGADSPESAFEWLNTPAAPSPTAETPVDEQGAAPESGHDTPATHASFVGPAFSPTPVAAPMEAPALSFEIPTLTGFDASGARLGVQAPAVPVADAGAAAAPHQQQFDEIMRGGAPVAPLTPAAEAVPNPIWAAHPLEGAPLARSAELDAPASWEMPRPDLTNFQSTATGSLPVVAQAQVPGHVEPPATGTSRAGEFMRQRKEALELQPAGGKQHLSWVHVMVMGSVVFVLVLIAYYASGLGS